MENTVFCATCGLETLHSSNFCAHCGARVAHQAQSAAHSASNEEKVEPARGGLAAELKRTSLKTVNDGPTAPTLNPSGVAEGRTTRSYIARHWTGDLSLPVSYWLNGFLGLVFVLGVRTILQSIDPTESWRGFAIVGMAMIGSVLLIQTWQIVGTWRSAEKHKSRGGSAFWAGAARIALIFGTLGFAGQAATSLMPMFTGFWELGFGGEQHDYQIRVLRDSTEIEFTGTIGFGATNEVERQLALYPTVTTIHLNSVGGRLAEARKLGRLISARKLRTTTSSQCQSACTIAFVSAERRVMGKGAVFGFHRPAFPGVSDSDLAQQYAADKAYLQSRGVDSSFIERIYATPSTEMWNPSEAELMASGFVTDFAGMDEVGLSGISSSDINAIESTLVDLPLYVAMKRHEPEAYRKVMGLYKDGFQRGRSLAELREETLPVIIEAYKRRLPYASDQAVLTATAVLVEEGRILERKGGLQCLTFYDMPEGQDGAPINPLTEFPTKLRKREQQSIADVLSSAAESPMVPERMDAMNSVLKTVAAMLAADFGADVRLIDEIATTDDEMAVKCDLYNSMFERILEQPPHKAAGFLRAMINES